MGVKLQSEPYPGTKRLTERWPVLIGVRVRRPGETWFKSQITDFTTHGFRLKSFMKLVPEDDLWIMLPGFEGRRARVLWSQAHESGCVFERPLHPAILDHIIKISQ
jgi:hypothetical protein